VVEFIICLAVVAVVLIVSHQAEREVLEAEVQEETKSLTLQAELLVQAAVVAHLVV
jgi:hypothetical protein